MLIIFICFFILIFIYFFILIFIYFFILIFICLFILIFICLFILIIYFNILLINQLNSHLFLNSIDIFFNCCYWVVQAISHFSLFPICTPVLAAELWTHICFSTKNVFSPIICLEKISSWQITSHYGRFLCRVSASFFLISCPAATECI